MSGEALGLFFAVVRLTPYRLWGSQRADEPVAQLVEHSTFNRMVLGSSPSRFTIFSEKSRCPYIQQRPAGGLPGFCGL